MDEKEQAPNPRRVYKNETIAVYWDPSRCIHAAACIRACRQVFRPALRPWVDVNAASPEEIAAAVNGCPSKALTFLWTDPERNRAETSPNLFAGDPSLFVAR